MTEPMVEVRFGSATDPGLVRSGNEDSYLTTPPVFLVADGMGGHARGEVASQCVANAFSPLGANRWVTADDVLAAVAEATERINQLGGEGRRPGSTLTGVGLSNQSGMPCWMVFNVGDSRTYLLRDGALAQISVDHSATRTTTEGITRQVITRALGAGLANPVVDQWLIPAVPGDRLMACSDGLTNEVTPELLTATLLTEPDPQVAAQTLLAAALRAGGRDNVTVVVVDCQSVVSTAGDAVSFADTTASDTLPDEELL